jgi:hypothetical protein
MAVAPMMAGPVAVGIWYEFSFTDAGVGATGCFPDDPGGGFCPPSGGTPTVFLDAPPWTIMLPTAGVLIVTDAFLSGDAFEILDFGGPIGMTPFVPVGADCFDDPIPCLSDPKMSHKSFPLAAGAHSFTIAPLASPFGGGAAYFLVAIPEPSTLFLAMAAGLALIVRSKVIR